MLHTQTHAIVTLTSSLSVLRWGEVFGRLPAKSSAGPDSHFSREALLRGQHRRGIPALTALDLGGCGRLTDDALCNMLPLCSSLTLLDLRGCKNLTARPRDLVSKYCPAMCELTFPKIVEPDGPV